jgi:glycosyltransferase 2 family protein
MKNRYRTAIWLTIALAALLFLVYTTPRADFLKAVRNIKWGWAILALFPQFLAITLISIRWVWLLRVHQVRISVFQAAKLTFLGFFYNNVMPGGVGGDLLKGWYITQHSDRDRRLEAAVTVFVDRIVGLMGMILLALFASCFAGPEMAYNGIQIRWIVWIIFAGMTLVLVIFLSHRIRKVLFVGKLLQKLSFFHRLKQVDEAMQLYRKHLPTICLSVLLTWLVQSLTIVSVWILTRSLGLNQVQFTQCLIIMPIVWLIGAAIPVPGGLGIIENSVKYLFAVVISAANPEEAQGYAAALALLNRVLLLYVCSLPGALVPLFGGHLPKAVELQSGGTLDKESK